MQSIYILLLLLQQENKKIFVDVRFGVKLILDHQVTFNQSPVYFGIAANIFYKVLILYVLFYLKIDALKKLFSHICVINPVLR